MRSMALQEHLLVNEQDGCQAVLAGDFTVIGKCDNLSAKSNVIMNHYHLSSLHLVPRICTTVKALPTKTVSKVAIACDSAFYSFEKAFRTTEKCSEPC